MSNMQQIAIRDLDIGTANPRKVGHAIGTLRASIEERGVLQNLIVRPSKVEGRFEIVAGQRRFIACTERVIAGEMTDDQTLPCLVRDLSDEDALEVALVENSQRADLHPLDEGRGYLTLWKSYRERGRADAGALVKRLARTMGRTARHIQMRMQLARDLCADVQDAFSRGDIELHEAEELLRRSDEEQRTWLTQKLDTRAERASAKPTESSRPTMQVSLDLSPDEISTLVKQAKAQGQTVSGYVTSLVRKSQVQAMAA